MTSCEPPPPPLPLLSPVATVTPNNNPRANVFIMVNLGCEMLYVIDQRLKAQQIVAEKSIKVMHDVTTVLLEPKFIDSIIVGSTQPLAQILSEDHCKFMLKDIATCSLMRLDEGSMDKLWNLMTMLYKWQLFHTNHQYQLMDITIRHLADIGELYPDEKRLQLIDYTKNTLLDFWNSFSDEEQHCVYLTNKSWLEGFHTKISLLIRLGFQALDGSFFEHVDVSYFNEFTDCVGSNVYVKSSDITLQKKQELADLQQSQTSSSSANCVNQLAEMLNYSQNVTTKDTDDLKPINFNDFQKQFEKNLQQCNILFEDLDVNVPSSSAAAAAAAICCSTSASGGEEFVHLNATYNKQNLEPGHPSTAAHHHYSNIAETSTSSGINKDLLDLYSKLN